MAGYPVLQFSYLSLSTAGNDGKRLILGDMIGQPTFPERLGPVYPGEIRTRRLFTGCIRGGELVGWRPSYPQKLPQVSPIHDLQHP